MSVTVDREQLAAEQLGLLTVGEVLTHVQRENRLVVNLLIDGLEPDLSQVDGVRKSLLLGHTIYIETVEPRQMASEVLDEVERQLLDADRLKSEAVEQFGRNNPQKGIQRLSGCFSTWQHAQESIRKTAQLLRVDLTLVRVGDISLMDFLAKFTSQLRDIRSALEMRDYVSLSDTLTYEMSQLTSRWIAAIDAVRSVMAA
jgi:hypothetical protein